MAADSADRWVVCIEHVLGPFTVGQASARLVEITGGIYTCRRDHHIVQSGTRPEPSYPPGGPQPLPATS